MIALFRAVKGSPEYRALRKEILSVEPDDVWHEPKQGWMLAFALRSDGDERLILFVVREPSDRGSARVSKALVIDRDGSCISVQPVK